MFADMLLPSMQNQIIALGALLINKGVITADEYRAACTATADITSTPEYQKILRERLAAAAK